METVFARDTFVPTKTNIMNIVKEFLNGKQESWFKEWFDTSFYHQLYANRNEKEASAFVDELIAELQPRENSLMLDLGCGTGRHARQLAKHGYSVTGLDLAPSSIRTARRTHTPGLQFYQHDMRQPFCVSRFNYVFSFFTSFGYFKTPEENNEVINNISMALKPNGLLMLDYLNVHYSENNAAGNEQKEIDGIVYHITRWHDNTHFHKHIEVADVIEGGKKFEYREQVEKLRLEDFDILFKRNGLKLEKVFGDYRLGEYDTELSPRLIMIAKKI
jgi:SAM-dependent methyltransferase